MRPAKTKPAKPGSLEQWFPGEGLYPSAFALGTHLPGLVRRGGIYMLWHLGVRPQWLHIGAAVDLAAALKAAARSPAIQRFRGNGEVYAAWSFPERTRWPGIVGYLRARLQPATQNTAAQDESLAYSDAIAFPLPPGTAS